LRNISGVFLVITGVLYFLLITVQFFSGRKDKLFTFNIILLPFMFSLAYIILISGVFVIYGLFYNNLDEMINGSSRLLFAPMIVFVVAKMPWTETRIEKILLTFSLITAVGCLSLPYQVFFGEITWFAESSMRAGFVRFASLFGSLTTIGMVGAIGVISTLFLGKVSNFQKALLLICIVTGLALSLQKAAVVNLVLAIVLSLYFANREVRSKITQIFFGLALVIFLGLPLIPDIQSIASATVQNFRFDENSESTGDVTVGESLLERTIDRPRNAIQSYGYEYLLTGVGIIGSAGALGLPEAESTHNTLADNALTGGVLNLSILLWLLYVMGREVMRPIPSKSVLSNNQYACARAVYFLVLFNLPFVSGMLLQPNISLLFYFFLGLAAAGYFRGIPVR
jgi:hypothetical protein